MATKRRTPKHPRRHDEPEEHDETEIDTEEEAETEEAREDSPAPAQESPPASSTAAPAPQTPPPGVVGAHSPALNASDEEAYKLMQAEARRQATELAKNIGQGPQPPKRPRDLRQGEEPMVACMVPKDFTLTLDDRITQVEFLEGIREIPQHLLDHWWVKANKVMPQKEE